MRENKDEANPRIVICGIGYYGCLLARIALKHGYTIVAAYNRAGQKVGQDLGRLIGLDSDIGVIVQDSDTADYHDLEADVGIVVQTNVLEVNFPTYKRLMSAGLNVICHGTEAYYPKGNNPNLAKEIDKLAKKNNVTFTGTGIWDMSRIWSGILLAGQCTRINSIFHRSKTDMKGQATRQQAIEFGCGLTVEEYLEKGIHKHKLFPTYKTVPEHVLAALGFTITETPYEITPVVFDEPLDDPFMGFVIPAGHVVGTRLVGTIHTEEGVTGKIEFEGRLFKPDEEETMFWSIDGNPRAQVTTTRMDSDYTTAACLFNRIKDIMAALPGNVLISQMGPTHSPELLQEYKNNG